MGGACCVGVVGRTRAAVGSATQRGRFPLFVCSCRCEAWVSLFMMRKGPFGRFQFGWSELTYSASNYQVRGPVQVVQLAVGRRVRQRHHPGDRHGPRAGRLRGPAVSGCSGVCGSIARDPSRCFNYKYMYSLAWGVLPAVLLLYSVYGSAWESARGRGQEPTAADSVPSPPSRRISNGTVSATWWLRVDGVGAARPTSGPRRRLSRRSRRVGEG